MMMSVILNSNGILGIPIIEKLDESKVELSAMNE